MTQGVLAKRSATANLTAAVLKERFDRLKDLGVSIASRPLLRQWVEEENWNQMEPMLQELLKEFPVINRFVLVDPSGTLMIDAPAIPLLRGKSLAYRDWFKGVSKNWTPYLSEIYSQIQEPHDHVVGMAVPIRSKTEKVVGILQLQESTDPFLTWSKEIDVGPAGFIYFVDQHGNITNHPKFSTEGEIINSSKVPAVQWVLQGKKETVGVFFDPAEKQELLLAYELVPGYGWGVIVQQPAAVAFAQRQRSLKLLLFIYGAVFLFICFLSARILRAITERQRAEERFGLVVEAAPNGMIMVGREGKITLVNSQIEKLFGYSREELLGQRIEMLVPERYRAHHPGHRDSFFADPKVRSMGAGRDLFGLKKDGSEVPIEIGLNPIETTEGLFTLASIIDITERKRAEAEVVAKNRELETTLHVVSHDLKEPLRAIEGFADKVNEGYASRLDEKGQDFLRRIMNASARMGRLLDDFLALSRSRRIEQPTGEVPGEVIVRETLERLKAPIEKSKARIEIAGDLPRLRANKTWAVEGLYNLLTNALKFTPPGVAPEIGIAAYRPRDEEPREVGLVVRDRGPGVAPEHKERIFELFQRAVGHEVEGTGAGLAIVRSVAEQHGGHAWVRPREGGGSEFIITFGKAKP